MSSFFSIRFFYNLLGGVLMVGMLGAVLAIAGPLGFLMTLLLFIGSRFLHVRYGGGVFFIALAFVTGLWRIGWVLKWQWLAAPLKRVGIAYEQALAGFSLDKLFQGKIQLAKIWVSLWGKGFWVWMQDTRNWIEFIPIAFLCTGLMLLIWEFYTHRPWRWLFHGKAVTENLLVPPQLFTARASNNQVGAAKPIEDSGRTFIGKDKNSGAAVYLTDLQANTHTLILGTTGSGKTNLSCMIMESAINRAKPILYMDGKGDRVLVDNIASYAKKSGRPCYVIGIHTLTTYHPFITGGFSAKAERLALLLDSGLAADQAVLNYLAFMFSVFEWLGMQPNLGEISTYIRPGVLKKLLQEQKPASRDGRVIQFNQPAEEPLIPPETLEEVQRHLQGLVHSQIGHVFRSSGPSQQSTSPPNPSHLVIPQAIQQGAVICFSLPSLDMPAILSKLMQLILSDLKAFAAQQLQKTIKDNFFVIVDELGPLAGPPLIGLLNQSRAAGFNMVVTAQSLGDIARSQPEYRDYLLSQVIANCNNYIIQRQNNPDDARMLVEVIGMKEKYQLTWLDSQDGVRRVRDYVIQPDEIKRLKLGEAVMVTKSDHKLYKLRLSLSNILQEQG
ncbi:MAG: type IV secretion system DNA-binding domain-containing protein [Rhodospirillaceae bacterium]|nr:type IV secretion system DNA-binding domain-containing protein [Rhodospirillaceae bacterium]